MRNAKVQPADQGGIWQVKVNVGHETFDIARDLTRIKNSHRRIDGKEVEAHQLEVNGKKEMLNPQY